MPSTPARDLALAFLFEHTKGDLPPGREFSARDTLWSSAENLGYRWDDVKAGLVDLAKEGRVVDCGTTHLLINVVRVFARTGPTCASP